MIAGARHVHLFFLDGVGLGDDDPEHNPFIQATLPNLTHLLGAGWYLRRDETLGCELISLAPTDARLGVAGRPQSATGQATILTGRNIPAAVGHHYGPKPDEAVRQQIHQGTIFAEVRAGGGSAALITPYPQRYFAGVASGKRLLSAVPLAATAAGLTLMTDDDLRAGRAVSPGFTGQAWRDQLGYDDIPIMTLPEAGRQIAAIAQGYHFSFFEHWPSDRAGHRGTVAAAAQHLEVLDQVLGALIAHWDHEQGLLIVTSDHGNIEDKSQRNHTLNPVPTLIAGPGHADYVGRIRRLDDIVPVIRDFLALPAP